jgi:hypothetical protein
VQADLSDASALVLDPSSVQLIEKMPGGIQGGSGADLWYGTWAGRQVVVKSMPFCNEAMMGSMRKEVLALLRVSQGCHHVCQCHGITIKEQRLCIVMHR